MRKLCLLCILCLLAGCKSASKGPLVPRSVDRADDPLLTPYEKQRTVRYEFAIPDDQLGPRSGTEKSPLNPPQQ
jgi:hypothetical protein